MAGILFASAFGVATSCGSQDNVEDDPAVELAGAAGRGERLATGRGCTGCHSVDGEEGIGPSFEHVWGRPVELEDGRAVTVDRDYLSRSTAEPDADIVKGYDSLMPSYDLTERELDDLAAYLKAIGPDNGR